MAQVPTTTWQRYSGLIVVNYFTACESESNIVLARQLSLGLSFFLSTF